MNTKMNFRGIMALLFLSMMLLAAAQQEVPGEQNQQQANMPQNEALTLFSSQEMLALSTRWMKEYGNLYPDLKMKLQAIPESGLKELPGESGAIILVESESLPLVRTEESRVLCIGREVFVPVVLKGNPLSAELSQKGIPPDLFESGHFSMGDLSVEISVLAGRDELEAFIRKGSRNLAFCRLADAIEPGGKELVPGLELVPVDKNRNGTIDYSEDIYKSPEILQRGVWIGKYPRSLYSNLYAVTNDRSPGKAELAFLNWLMTGGQSELASAGYSGITESELYSMRGKLTASPAAELVLPPDAARSRSLWVPAGSVLILLGIAIIPFLFFRKSDAEESEAIAPGRMLTGEGTGSVPGGLYFDKSHTWAFMEKEGTVRVGIDPFLQRVTGPISRVVTAETGTRIRKGDAFLTLVQNGKKLQIKSPVSGVVRELNPKLHQDPSAISRDPFQEGWVCTLEPLNWMKEIRAFFMADRYGEWIITELQRLKEFFSGGIRIAGKPGLITVLQDGGEPEPGILGSQGPEVWEEFQVHFINKA